MVRWMLAVCAIMAVASLPATAAASAAQDLGPVPGECGALKLDFTNPTCLVSSRLGSFALSPHVVHAGGTLTGTISPTCSRPDGNGGRIPCPYVWPDTGASPTIGFGALKAKHGCTATDTTCAWEVAKNAPSSSRWTIMVAGVTNEQGTGIAKDYYAIAGKGTSVLQVSVTGGDGAPLNDVAVHVTGPSQIRLKTAAGGTASAMLDRGRYKVTPFVSGGVVFVPKRSGDCSPVGESCSVSLDRDRSIAFTADASHLVKVALDPASITADGLGRSALTVTDTDAAGSPIAGERLTLSPPLGDALPRALVCSPRGRLYPTVYPASATISGSSFDAQTDASGRIDLTVMAGTQGGAWLTTATIPGSTRTGETGYGTLTLTTPAGRVDAGALADTLRSRAGYEGRGGTFGAGPGVTPNTAQDLVLDFLARLKFEGSLPGVDFAPIHSTEPAGHEGVAVLFYPAGTAPDRILLQGQQGVVWDIGELLRGSGTIAVPTVLPTLADWSFNPSYAHGLPLRGHATHVPGEEVAYFGMPYPPPEGSLDTAGRVGRKRYDEQCTPPAGDLVTVAVHSPVAVRLVDGAGHEIGVNATGRPVTTAPGYVFPARGGGPATIVAPAGTWRMAMTGTGSGPATVVVTGATGDAQVLDLRARRGATGTAALTPSGLTGATFAGRRLTATRGVGMRVTAAPRRLKATAAAVKLRVADQFGAAVPGAVVHASGAGTGAATTDRRGRATLHVAVKRAGTVTVAVTAPGLRDTRLRLTARGRPR